jgi:hypothetical protein
MAIDRATASVFRLMSVLVTIKFVGMSACDRLGIALSSSEKTALTAHSFLRF